MSKLFSNAKFRLNILRELGSYSYRNVTICRVRLQQAQKADRSCHAAVCRKRTFPSDVKTEMLHIV
jgi:hypothetical protein